MTEPCVSPTTLAGKPPLDTRPLLAPDQARELADLYQVLANDTRLRLLHALARSGELCVTDLAAAVAMRPQAVSNQLQRLADRRILASRRDGTRIYYRLADPCVPSLLDLGWCLVEETAGG
jgi:DNA-binding transcriptional ArsR family regulator